MDAFTLTVTVPGALRLEDVAVSHGESDVTVKGTRFPVPTAVTWKDCDAGDCVLLGAPVKVRLEVDKCNIGFVVTTKVTGIEVTIGWPEILIKTVVV
jgi:hypothetical protein